MTTAEWIAAGIGALIMFLAIFTACAGRLNKEPYDNDDYLADNDHLTDNTHDKLSPEETRAINEWFDRNYPHKGN